MKNLIVGTAGHIDHGKTTLIKNLTGTNTDRWKEEQKRGITIDIGFAHLLLPSGTSAGIIDVPGHEKFIRNMLAGVGGIDVVILVVAADEGIMPQTREHLDILSLLDIKNGMIALTKIDMVDSDMVELVKEDLQEELKGTFLDGAPIIPFSGLTGEGKDDIIGALDKVALETEEKESDTRPRLPIDRSFVLEGIGTVVTGTLVEGEIHVDDALMLYPPRKATKVRSIQSHGKKANTAHAGQRTAINVSGLAKEDVKRGYVLAKEGTMHTSNLLDCKLKMLESAERAFSNRTRIRFHHGTSETIGRMVLLGDSEAKAGDEVYVQFLLEDEIAVRTGDRFIIRNYSPVTTIGGGVIIDANPLRHKRFKADTLESLEKIDAGGLSNLLEENVRSRSIYFERLSSVLLPLGQTREEVKEPLSALIKNGVLIPLSEEDPVLLHRDFYENLVVLSTEILKKHHEQKPLETGMSKEEFRVRLCKKARIVPDISEIRGAFKALEDKLVSDQFIDAGEKVFSAHGFKVKVGGQAKEIADKLSNYFEKPATPFEVLKNFSKKEGADRIFLMMVNQGRLTKLNPETAMDTERLTEATEKVKRAIQNSDEKNITLASARDMLGVSRKQALSILEYLDKTKITRKKGDFRVLF